MENDTASNSSAPDNSRLTRMREQMLGLQKQIQQAEDEVRLKQSEAGLLETELSWEAPNRVYVERGRSYYVLISLIGVLVIGFAALAREILLIFVTISILVLLYLAANVKPKLVKHELTNKGVKTAQQLYSWKNITGFWIGKRADQLILVIDLELTFTPNRLILLVGAANPRKLVELMIKHIPYLPRKQINIDIVNAFTLGEYMPITTWIETEQ